MKKLILVPMILFMTIGCGKDKLICTSEDDGHNMTYIITFKKSIADKATIKRELNSAEECQDLLDIDTTNEKIHYKCEGKTMVITMKDMGSVEDEVNEKSEVKAELEKEGFTCK